jgi:hypothetical protein
VVSPRAAAAKEQLRQLAQQGTLASRISALVHMLQCERGASNLWLCSAGRLYAAECRAGSALVDEQLIAFREALEAVRECASGALCWRIASALWYLEQLLTLRDAVRGRAIIAEEATNQFSRIIRHLLNIVPQLNDSIDDPQIAGRMVALYSFMQGKELVGQERALGASGFARGSLAMSCASCWWTESMVSSPVLTASRRWRRRRRPRCL